MALDEQGELVEETVIYPHEPQKRAAEAKQALAALAARHRIEAVAVGNGTAGRETHELVRAMKREKLLAEACVVVLVNESGASVYSASEIAREEFPDQDVTVRGAGVDRAAAAGSARRAGEDRPQVDRRRPVPARREPARPQASRSTRSSSRA